MRMSKTCLLAVIIILVGAFFLGCDPPFQIQYQFQQERTNVKQVEICGYNTQTEKYEVLNTLSESQIDSIWKDILETTCHDPYGMPWTESDASYGDVFIRITYQNGDKELLGPEDIVRVSSDGQELVGRYFFIPQDIYEVVGKYVDIEVLKEVCTYFKHKS